MCKKFFLLTVTFLLFTKINFAQVGIGTTTPHASSKLDITSTNSGLLIPRMTTTQRTTIASPANGLLVFDNTTNTFWFYNGAAWIQMITTSSSDWSLAGNAGTNPTTHFIGTTDASPLKFRINNVNAGTIDFASNNTAIGFLALNMITTGTYNVALGNNTLTSNTQGTFNTANGYGALFNNTTGSQNTANGYQALFNNTVGFKNTANGINSLYSNTIGFENTANGREALYSNTTGKYNTATGIEALYSNTTGFENTANGAYALNSSTAGNYNTANGVKALFSNTIGSQNTANGNGSLYSNTEGNYNAATGTNALLNNTEGNQNTANGHGALISNIMGNNNTAIGTGALNNNTNGNNNTAAGIGALYSNSTGDYNIAIGSLAGPAPGFTNLSNTINIGNDGSFQNQVSNQAIIGNSSTVFIGGKVNWGTVSDARIKNDVKEDVKGLDFILKLRPVTYHISNAAINAITKTIDTTNFPGKYDGEKIKYTGFLAQEVEQAAIAANYQFSGYDTPKNERDLYKIKYAEFVVPIVKAVQEQQGIITNQQKQIDLLEKRLAALETKNKPLK